MLAGRYREGRNARTIMYVIYASVVYLVLHYLLNAVFGDHVVAISPFPLPLAGSQLTFISWYFLSSFAVNFPIMRLFGIGMSDN